jgi:proline dehydrogenase
MIVRKTLLYLSTAAWARHIAVRWQVARRVARRFVAGETLDEAIAVAKTLEKKGILATLDYLGESVAKAEDTVEVVETYKMLLQRIHAEKLASSVSLKLTHIGFDISEDLCMTNLRHIVATAQAHHIPVTLDMESTAYTDATLRIYRTLRDEYAFDNVGTVIQAYLYRSEKDMQDLKTEGAHIRLCKGAYLESPDVAFPEKSDVDKNYVHLAQQYLQNEQQAYLCLATHDENMIAAAEAFIAQQHIAKDRYEFQMLYGVRNQRQEELAKTHKMRVYVPFGSAWYPYFVRRLAERPANVWFFVKNITG